MASLSQKIESLLFISTHPLTAKRLAELVDIEIKKVEDALLLLCEEYKKRNGGMQVIKNGKEYQMVTSSECTKLVEEYVRKEETGELTRPQLETLTVVAYRGPIGKPELDQIRGVNCSLILRNLMIRGLIQEDEDKHTGEVRYIVTMDFVRFLGLRGVEELHNYERLRGDKTLSELLSQMKSVTKKEDNE